MSTMFHKFVEWQKRFLYNPMPAIDIGFFRFAYCGLLGVFSLSRVGWYREIIQQQIFNTTRFEYYHFLIAGREVWYLLSYLHIFFIFMAAVGLFTRFSIIAAFLSYVSFVFPVDFQLTPFDNNLVFYVLLVLCFAPGVSSLSLDEVLRAKASDKTVPRWPRQTIIILLGLSYFGAAAAKFSKSGLGWMDGEYLRSYLYERYIVTASPVPLWVAGHPWLCFFMATVTVFFEVFFIALVFSPRLYKTLIAIGLMIHITIYLVMKVNFLKYYVLTYLIFLQYSKLAPLAHKRLKFLLKSKNI